MGFVERTLSSGVILSESGMDHAAIERELKRRDPSLFLQGWPSDTHGCILWKVVRDEGSERPPRTICVWQSDRGEPYPLSSGILNLLDQLDRNTRSSYASDDERNAARRQEISKQDERSNEALRDDHAFPHGHPITPRGQWLRMHRDKQRARGKKV